MNSNSTSRMPMLAGVIGAGLVGMRFNTIGVSDGISMGTEGMSFSLQSRDLIATACDALLSKLCIGAAILSAMELALGIVANSGNGF